MPPAVSGVALTIRGGSSSLTAMNADPTKTHVAKAYKHASPLISCRFDPSGRFVFFGDQENGVWRWQWDSDAVVEFAGHDSWVRAIGFSPDGKTLLTGGYDGRLIWWPADAEQPQPVRSVDAHAGWLRALAVSPDGERVATCGNDHLVKLWKTSDGELLQQFAGHDRHVYNVTFHPDGNDLVSGDLMGQLLHWEVASGKQVRKLEAASLTKYDKTFKADIGGFRDLTFSPDGQRLAGSGITEVTNAFAGVGNPLAVELDWESGKEAATHAAKAKPRGVLWRTVYHPDGFLVGISGGGSGGFLLFWKPADAEEFHQTKLPNTARDLDLSSDGLHLVTPHFDRQIRISRMAAQA